MLPTAISIFIFLSFEIKEWMNFFSFFLLKEEGKAEIKYNSTNNSKLSPFNIHSVKSIFVIFIPKLQKWSKIWIRWKLNLRGSFNDFQLHRVLENHLHIINFNHFSIWSFADILLSGKPSKKYFQLSNYPERWEGIIMKT